MALKGPLTLNTGSLALGLAQIRVGASATYISMPGAELTASDSIGAMASTKFMGNTDWYKHEAGFPLVEDFTTPIRDAAALECAFEEMSAKNLDIAMGVDPTIGSYTYNSGEVALGNRSAPAYVRMEAHYTYPSGTDYMDIIFPRAQVSAAIEMDLQTDTNAAVTITFESKRADSNVSGGNAQWDAKTLGHIIWTHD